MCPAYELSAWHVFHAGRRWMLQSFNSNSSVQEYFETMSGSLDALFEEAADFFKHPPRDGKIMIKTFTRI